MQGGMQNWLVGNFISHSIPGTARMPIFQLECQFVDQSTMISIFCDICQPLLRLEAIR